MELKLTIPANSLDRVIPPSEELAQAAADDVRKLVKQHLRNRNMSSAPAGGMPKSNYYGDAADATGIEKEGKQISVVISKEGAALHYYGGTVYPGPGKKALAIPKHPQTAGKRAAEFSGAMFVVWGKGKTSGMLVSCEPSTAGELMYLLLPKATIPADPTVLPSTEQMMDAANAAITRYLELMS